jgi:hypothetical protein
MISFALFCFQTPSADGLCCFIALSRCRDRWTDSQSSLGLLFIVFFRGSAVEAGHIAKVFGLPLLSFSFFFFFLVFWSLCGQGKAQEATHHPGWMGGIVRAGQNDDIRRVGFIQDTPGQPNVICISWFGLLFVCVFAFFTKTCW